MDRVSPGRFFAVAQQAFWPGTLLSHSESQDRQRWVTPESVMPEPLTTTIGTWVDPQSGHRYTTASPPTSRALVWAERTHVVPLFPMGFSRDSVSPEQLRTSGGSPPPPWRGRPTRPPPSGQRLAPARPERRRVQFRPTEETRFVGVHRWNPRYRSTSRAPRTRRFHRSGGGKSTVGFGTSLRVARPPPVVLPLSERTELAEPLAIHGRPGIT